MDHYLELRLLPDPEFSPPLLMNALFAKLHRVLVQLDSQHIGVSFPEVAAERSSLGRVLRLHGTSAVLQNLLVQNWLMGMRDHIEVMQIDRVPSDAQHCRVQRVQVKSSAERLRHRYRKRHPEVDANEVEKLIPYSDEKRVKHPFVQLKSGSTGQHFYLFLRHLPPQKEPERGGFNSYGLSTSATVPWF